MAALARAGGAGLSRVAAKRMREMLLHAGKEVEQAIAALDPVKEPASWFDPADSVTAGRLVAAALIAQPRVAIELVQPSYGAGVYAIYYKGDHPAYGPISGTETPIYVGKADPDSASAATPRQQGPKLSGRLADHRKTIRTVETYAKTNALAAGLHPLAIAHFECRKLVTATHAQMYAERHLIDMFKPVWNSETKICWGMSMHGDTTGRNNARPPWHVLHPGVSWALRENIVDSRPSTQIITDLAAHFGANLPYGSSEQIIDTFLKAFAQDPMAATTPVSDEAAENIDETIATGANGDEDDAPE